MLWKFKLCLFEVTTTDKTGSGECVTVLGELATLITSILLLGKLRIGDIWNGFGSQSYIAVKSGFYLVFFLHVSSFEPLITAILSSAFQLPSLGSTCPISFISEAQWCGRVMVIPWSFCLRYGALGHPTGVFVFFTEGHAACVVSESWLSLHSYGDYGVVFSLKFTYSVWKWLVLLTKWEEYVDFYFFLDCDHKKTQFTILIIFK